MDTKIKLSPITTNLHWIIGISMIVLIVMGLYMEEFDAEYLFDIHISLGVIVGLIVVPRVLWRIKNGWPTHVAYSAQNDHSLRLIVITFSSYAYRTTFLH